MSHGNIQSKLLSIIDDVLHLGGRWRNFRSDTPLLGAQPEIDSMGVVSILTALEESLGISVEDDEIDGATFQTLGTLTEFVAAKLA